MRLADLQANFQKAVLDSDSSVLEHLRGSSKQSTDVLFDVYRLGYAGRLVEVLEAEYEVLSDWLGNNFSDMARAYIAVHPSDVHNARWFGRHLPSFLAARANDAPTQVSADLAALEMALSDAFDAPDAETLEIGDLATLAPESWPQLTLQPHPSARSLCFKSNAADIWAALREEEAIPDPAYLVDQQNYIVWRSDFASRFRPMAPDEDMMWREAAKGVSFGVLCEMIAMFGGEDGAEMRAASYLKGWLDSGMLARG